MEHETLLRMAQALRQAGWGVIPPEQYIIDMDENFLKLWEEIRPYTMISIERAWAFAQAVSYVCRSNIAGDIAECGVWKGGACLLASHVLDQEGDEQRQIWLYDTFEGMPSPGADDRIAASGQAMTARNPKGWWSVDIAEVKSLLSSSVPDKNRFKFVKGLVEKTLVKETPKQLSVLRLDTDWYESTAMELEVLYPRLSRGGVLIIDDYGHFTGVRKAVDEYLQRQEIVPLLHRSDYTGRVFIKPDSAV